MAMAKNDITQIPEDSQKTDTLGVSTEIPVITLSVDDIESDSDSYDISSQFHRSRNI